MEHRTGSRINAQIYEEACEWFLEFRIESPGGASRSRFDAWMRRSPEHVAAYLEVAALWNDPAARDVHTRWDRSALVQAAIAEPENVVPLAPSGAWANLAPASASRGVANSPPRADSAPRGARIRFSRKPVIAAACAALLAAVGGVYLWLTRVPVYVTDVGEQRLVTLADGSTVELDAQTRLAVRFSQKARRVDLLEGQALFHIAKESLRPFVVRSGETRVRAIGTEFDVYRQGTNTFVTVVEGRVAVEAASVGTAAPGSTLSRPTDHASSKSDVFGSASSDRPPGATYLGAGEQVIAAPKALRKSSHPDITRATAWVQRKVVFDGAYLPEIAREFNRYSHRRLIIEDSAPADFRLSGVFSMGDIDSIIRFLRVRPELELIETSGEIRVRKKIG